MHSYWRRWPQKKKKLFYRITLKIICKLQKQIKIIVLGEWVYKNIQKDDFLNKLEKDKINWINHPGKKARNIKCKNDTGKINFGFIGDQTQPYKFIDLEYLERIKKTIINLGHNIIIDSKKFIQESNYIII